MNSSNLNSQEHIYTQELILFASVGVDFASSVEQASDASSLISSLMTILPRLYGCVVALPDYLFEPEVDYIEEYINEHSYEHVRSRLESIFEEHDRFLSLRLSNDGSYEEPISISLAECIADVYQHVGNLLGIIKARNEIALPAAIGRCCYYWREYWGDSLLMALRALHTLYTRKAFYTEEDTEDDSTPYDTYL